MGLVADACASLSVRLMFRASILSFPRVVRCGITTISIFSPLDDASKEVDPHALAKTLCDNGMIDEDDETEESPAEGLVVVFDRSASMGLPAFPTVDVAEPPAPAVAACDAHHEFLKVRQWSGFFVLRKMIGTAGTDRANALDYIWRRSQRPTFMRAALHQHQHLALRIIAAVSLPAADLHAPIPPGPAMQICVRTTSNPQPVKLDVTRDMSVARVLDIRGTLRRPNVPSD